MNKLLSIIIPTRNRQKYCLEAVREILSLNTDLVEICIQDNSDDNTLEKDIRTLNSDSIVYNYHVGILSFIDNFNEAISISSGSYLCMIGDDDGILPNIIPTVKYMEKKDLDGLIPRLCADYFWPSTNPIYPKAENGYLILTGDRADYKSINPLKGLQRFIENGLLNYLTCDMPKLYHGIIKKSVLEEIKDKVGNYFGGLTPDIFMATALCLVAKKIEKVEYPVTISGICPTSGSSDSATGKHTGELKDAPHFRGHENYKWEETVPPFYSVETIWAETAIKALKLFGREDMITMIDFSLLYSTCLQKYPQFSKIIYDSAELNHVEFVNVKSKPKINQISSFIHKVIRRLRFGKSKIFYNVKDIIEAKNIIQNNIKIKLK